MKSRTRLVLFIGMFNALWLAHVFVVLGLQGIYPIREPTAWVAWTEFTLCLVIVGLSIERLLNLRERK